MPTERTLMALVILGRRASSGRPLVTSVAAELPIVVFGPATLVLIGECSVVSVAETAGWSPADLAGTLVAWYDAQDVGTITQSGGDVSQWDDKSGNARHMVQATGSRQPAYGANALAPGYPGLTYTEADDTQLVAPVSGITSTMTGYVVAFLTSTATHIYGRLLNVGIAGSSDNNPFAAALLLREATNEKILSFFNGTLDTAISITYDTPFLAGGRVTEAAGSTTLAVRLNGNADVTAVAGTAFDGSTADSLSIGDNLSTAPENWDGVVSEVIYTAGESSGDREKIEGYLAWKWGLEANLPGGHPYVAAPP